MTRFVEFGKSNLQNKVMRLEFCPTNNVGQFGNYTQASCLSAAKEQVGAAPMDQIFLT
jgi:hypothetical protein